MSGIEVDQASLLTGSESIICLSVVNHDGGIKFVTPEKKYLIFIADGLFLKIIFKFSLVLIFNIFLFY